jgi:hypothetical protein
VDRDPRANGTLTSLDGNIDPHHKGRLHSLPTNANTLKSRTGSLSITNISLAVRFRPLAQVLTMAKQPIARIVPILPVKNLARAMDYYRHLGFSTKAYEDGDDYGFLTRDAFEIHLTQSDMLDDKNPGCGVYFYLASGTAAALEAEFRTAGVKILSSLAPREWKMNEFVLCDPDANLLRFGEALP